MSPLPHPPMSAGGRGHHCLVPQSHLARDAITAPTSVLSWRDMSPLFRPPVPSWREMSPPSRFPVSAGDARRHPPSPPPLPLPPGIPVIDRQHAGRRTVWGGRRSIVSQGTRDSPTVTPAQHNARNTHLCTVAITDYLENCGFWRISMA